MDPNDYEFRITAPSATGVYIGSRCDYSSLPSTTRTPYRTHTSSFSLVRCERGYGVSEITIESRHRATRADVDNTLERLAVPKARRQGDKTVSYRFCDPLPPPSTPPDPELNYDDAFVLGAGEWNSESTGMSIQRRLSGACNVPNRVAVSFVPGDPCGNSDALACVLVPFTTDLDSGTIKMQIDVQLPARHDWTSNHMMRSDDSIRYLPAVISHEFGHAAGLGHSEFTTDVMYKDYLHNVIAPSSKDVRAMRDVYR